MERAKIFIVGPHLKERYEALRNFVENHCSTAWPDVEIEVAAPTDNPQTDNFNDWIFGQIDTCDLLIADLSDFNPNVVYEVAFAHTLGTPCVYVLFSDADSSKKQIDDIKHYFKLTLMAEAADEASSQAKPQANLNEVTEAGLNEGAEEYLAAHIDRFLSGEEILGQSILSDYYGAFPADAEFMRGLAEGYYRNLLQPVLTAQKSGAKLKLIIPDTFETTDSFIDEVSKTHLPGEYEEFPNAKNSLDRPLRFVLHKSDSGEFFYDIPTTVLTVTRSSKYQKISEASYFTPEVRDALTDKLARKFVAHLWHLIKQDRGFIKMPLSNFEVCWLSDIVQDWHQNTSLLNTSPLERPQGF